MYSKDYLAHYGIPGMRWGRRIARSELGLPYTVGKKQLTKKRQIDADRKSLAELKKGGHTSIGFTKKRQKKLDSRDISILEKRISKNEYLTSEAGKKAVADGKKKVDKLLLSVGKTAVAVGILSEIKIPSIKTNN